MSPSSQSQSKPSTACRPRQRLDTLDRVRREAVRIYREGRDGIRPAGDVHQLAATLAIVGQLIEGGRT